MTDLPSFVQHHWGENPKEYDVYLNGCLQDTYLEANTKEGWVIRVVTRGGKPVTNPLRIEKVFGWVRVERR